MAAESATEISVLPETEVGVNEDNTIVKDEEKNEEEGKEDGEEEEEEEEIVVDIASLPKFHISGRLGTWMFFTCIDSKLSFVHLQCLRISRRASYRMGFGTIITCDTGDKCPFH